MASGWPVQYWRGVAGGIERHGLSAAGACRGWLRPRKRVRQSHRPIFVIGDPWEIVQPVIGTNRGSVIERLSPRFVLLIRSAIRVVIGLPSIIAAKVSGFPVTHEIGH